MTHLIQIRIPIYDNHGHRFEQRIFESVRAQLIERFGGLTAFLQSPALGLWKDAHSGIAARDDMILIEVMIEAFDRVWWSAYRVELEHIFRQDEILYEPLLSSKSCLSPVPLRSARAPKTSKLRR